MEIEEGSCYHVYNRGNNKGLIFFSERDYEKFLEKFRAFLGGSIDLYAYCLMPNHFHFFLRVNKRVAFEKGIKNFFISYVKSINCKYERVGSLFQGRYKRKLVGSDTYFTRAITYIHQNSLSLPSVIKLQDYRYSSYYEYLSDEPSYLNKEEVLSWFGSLENFLLEHE